MISEKRREWLLGCWENERYPEDEEWRDELTEEEQELVDSWDAGYATGIAELMVSIEDVIRRGEEQEGWQLYTEYRDGEPVGYRYGPDWVAMELYCEGGFKTPEEAKLRWLEYWEAHR